MVQLSPPAIPPHSREAADQHLSARVHRALVSTGQFPLRRIRVAVHDGQVSLVGTLPSFYLKQVAQEAAMAVPGVHALDNQLLVD